MALRTIHKDEYARKGCNYRGTRYHHVEHARWSALWTILGMKFEYRPRKHEVLVPMTGRYKRGEEDDTVWYSPSFYLSGMDVFVDIKKQPPKPESTFIASDLFRITGIPVVMFEGPMFVPNWTTLSPRATFCRESPSPQPYYLQFDGRVFKISPNTNESDVLHPRLREAFSQALQI